jgi:hypothetical protein
MPSIEDYLNDSSAVSGPRRQSGNVRDIRGQPWGLRDHLAFHEDRDYLYEGREPYRPTPPPAHAEDNRHTQAVDGLVARLEGYQPPGRQRLLAPSSIDVPEMQRYYTPPPDTPEMVARADIYKRLQGLR